MISPLYELPVDIYPPGQNVRTTWREIDGTILTQAEHPDLPNVRLFTRFFWYSRDGKNVDDAQLDAWARQVEIERVEYPVFTDSTIVTAKQNTKYVGLGGVGRTWTGANGRDRFTFDGGVADLNFTPTLYCGSTDPNITARFYFSPQVAITNILNTIAFNGGLIYTVERRQRSTGIADPIIGFYAFSELYAQFE